MRILVLFLMVFTGCSGQAPQRETAAPAPSYAYTERFFAAKSSLVEKAGVTLLREMIQASSPRVPSEVQEGPSSAATGWIYAAENGQQLRRRYHLNFVDDGNGTLVILSLEEERRPSGEGWQPAVPLDTTYQAFFTRLNNKVRKLR